jgi:hypothetical protein
LVFLKPCMAIQIGYQLIRKDYYLHLQLLAVLYGSVARRSKEKLGNKSA